MKINFTKVLLIFFLGIIFIAICGYKIMAGENASAKIEINENAVPPQTTPEQLKKTRVWTEVEFIEYMAQTGYLADKYSENPVKFAEEMGNVYKKLGVEGMENNFYENYNTWFGTWMEKAICNPESSGKEWEQIMKRVEARIEVLKKGN